MTPAVRNVGANTSLEDAENVHSYRYEGAQLYNYEPVRHQRGQGVMSAFKCHLLSFCFLSPSLILPYGKTALEGESERAACTETTA